MNSMSSESEGAKMDREKVQTKRISGFHTVLSVAGYYGQLVGAKRIVLAITKDQIEAIPNTPLLLRKFQEILALLNPEAEELEVSAPFGDLSKSEIVTMGSELGVPFELTWSCLSGQELHCGECIQCRVRREAFANAGIEDPTEYAT
jgi:7-cyano-7-deazaguanine synthase